jgi:hypothetical protein
VFTTATSLTICDFNHSESLLVKLIIAIISQDILLTLGIIIESATDLKITTDESEQ